jgi:hypothetical protein
MDLFGPPIEECEYDAVLFVGQERVDGLFQNRVAKWLVTMKIEGGPCTGRHLLFAVPCLKRGRPRPSFKFSRLYAAVSRGRRLPRDCGDGRRKISSLARSCAFAWSP